MELESFESPSTDLITALPTKGGEKRKQDKRDTWGRRIIEEHSINFFFKPIVLFLGNETGSDRLSSTLQNSPAHPSLLGRGTFTCMVTDMHTHPAPGGVSGVWDHTSAHLEKNYCVRDKAGSWGGGSQPVGSCQALSPKTCIS